MTSRFYSIRVVGIALMFTSFALGLVSTWLWVHSTSRWNNHLNNAYLASVVLFDALKSGSVTAPGFAIALLPEAEHDMAARGEFDRLPDVRRPALVTNISILANPSDPLSGEALSIAVVSPDLRYPLAGLPTDQTQTPMETFAALSRMLATYCSDPIMFARFGDEPWVRVEAREVWNCSAAPADLRLLAAILGVVSLGVIATLVLNASVQFGEFADALRGRRRLGGPDTYDAAGPKELREIVDAVNAHLEIEREQLSKRAIVLSGVSHDLGTPATRLRLRTALISDPELRTKLETDIDRMTGIIESVLTYTRAELNSEEPRQISLSSLVEAVVADYQDTGNPVEFRPADSIVVLGGQSLFMSKRSQHTLSDARRVVVTARPVSLQRAISNLIDNALKYGRRATVGLETDAEHASVIVEDEGTETTVGEIEALMAPFQRGANTQSINGYGLGLTIAATVASLHGGALTFEPGAKGLRARITIERH